MTSARYTMSILPTSELEVREHVAAMPVEKLLRVPTEKDSLIEELMGLRDPLERLLVDDVTITTDGTHLHVDLDLPRPLEELPAAHSDALGRTMKFRARVRPAVRSQEPFSTVTQMGFPAPAPEQKVLDQARLMVSYDTMLWSDSAEIVADIRLLVDAYNAAVDTLTRDIHVTYFTALDERHARVLTCARIDQLARDVDKLLRA